MQPTDVTIATIHTACKGCAFATWLGKTQSGCQLGRLTKFREQGSVVDAFDADGDEFAVVNGRICHAKRDEKWRSQFRSITSAEAVVRAEIAITVDVLVMVDEKTTESELKQTLSGLKKARPGPAQVIVVSNQDAMKASKLHVLLSKYGKGLNWSLTDIIARKESGERVGKDRAVDLAINKVSSHFYATISPGFLVPPTLVKDIDKAINEDLKRFVVLTTETGRCTVVQTGFHKNSVVQGNSPVTVQPEEGPSYVLTSVVEKAMYYDLRNGTGGFVGLLSHVVGDTCRKM